MCVNAGSLTRWESQGLNPCSQRERQVLHSLNHNRNSVFLPSLLPCFFKKITSGADPLFASWLSSCEMQMTWHIFSVGVLKISLHLWPVFKVFIFLEQFPLTAKLKVQSFQCTFHPYTGAASPAINTLPQMVHLLQQRTHAGTSKSPRVQRRHEGLSLPLLMSITCPNWLNHYTSFRKTL